MAQSKLTERRQISTDNSIEQIHVKNYNNTREVVQLITLNKIYTHIFVCICVSHLYPTESSSSIY